MTQREFGMVKQIIQNIRRPFERAVMPFAEGASDWPLLAAVRSGLIVTMPLVLLGSCAVLLNSFPLPAYKTMMQDVFGPNWQLFGGFVWNGTFAVMSLILLFSIGQHLAEQYNAANPVVQVSPVITGLVAFASLVCMIEVNAGMLPQRWIGVAGLFVALLVALVASRLFLFLFSCKSLRLHLPGGSTDLAVPHAFNALLPGMLTVLLFAGIGIGVQALWGTSVHEAVHTLIRKPFDAAGDGLERGVLYIASLQWLWFFGIHGANVLDPITHDIYGAAMAANEAAAAAGKPLPHIMTKPFMDTFVFMGGAGASISLAGALLLFGNAQANRKLAGLSLVPGIFNINEVLLFGLPVILNPVMLIPFVLTPLLLALISYVAVASGLVPGTRAAVEWTTPILLNGYLTTGSIKGTALQLVNITVGIFAYAPFVLISNKLTAKRVGLAFRRLLTRSCATANGPLGQRCIDQRDDAGALARGLLADLEEARLSGRDLYLEFQPQITATTGRVAGVEALLRWKHPHHGPIPAPITVALAEDSAMIRPLGLWILDQACSVRKAWLNAGIEDLVMSVNLSAMQLEESLPDNVTRILQRHALPPDMLELEVTESGALDTGTPESQVLSRLHALGVRITIDDFGMGHSSLKYLKQFPVTAVKIDGAISREVVTNPICADIVGSITRLCRARGMTSVAEFVENDAQVAVLREQGVDLFQGYRFSKPLVADACLAYIIDNYAKWTPARFKTTA